MESLGFSKDDEEDTDTGLGGGRIEPASVSGASTAEKRPKAV